MTNQRGCFGWSGLALLVVMVTACSDGVGVDGVLSAAKSKVSSGDRAGAMAQLQIGLKRHPDAAQLRLEFARLLTDQGDHRAAQIELRRLLPQAELAPQVVPLLVRSMVQAGQFDKIISEFGSARFSDPKAMADLMASLALANGVGQRSDQAKALADEALKLDPAAIAPKLVLARLKSAEQGPAAALADVQAMLAVEPASAEAWLLKADLQVVTGAPPHQDALTSYRRAADLMPGAMKAHAAIVGIQLAMRDVEGVAAAIQNLRKYHPAHPQTAFFQAQLAFLRKDYKLASEMMAQVLRVMPDAVNALAFAGAVELQRGASVQAEALLSKAVSKDPKRQSTKRLLASAYLQSGQPAKAVELLTPLVQGAPDEFQVDTLLLLADSLLQQGNHALAEQYFQRAQKQRPADNKLRVSLALIDVSKGQFEQGIAELEAISAADKEAVADKLLINALLARRDADRAIAAVGKLEKKEPHSALAASLRGYAQLIKGDVGAARASFDAALTRNPRYAPAVSALAGLDTRDGKFDAALQRHADILKVDPKNLQSLVAVAELTGLKGGTREEVVKLFEAAVAAHPADPLPRRLMVHYLIGRNDFRGALLAASAAANALPRDTEVLGALAQAQLLSGDTNQALSTLSKSLSLNAKLASTYVQMANTMLAAGDTAGAEKNFRYAAVVEPASVQVRLNLVSMYLRQKNFAKALSEVRHLQKALPNEAAPDILEGDVHVAAGQLDLALIAFRRGLDRTNYGVAPARVHATLLALKRSEQAEKFSNDWLVSHSKDLQFLVYMGKRALVRNDMKTAEALHRRAIELDQHPDVSLLNNLAWVLIRTGSPDALTYAERAHRLAPDLPAVVDNYAQALGQANKVTDAIQVINAARAKKRSGPALEVTLIGLYVRAGERAKAMELFEQLQMQAKSVQDRAMVEKARKLLES